MAHRLAALISAVIVLMGVSVASAQVADIWSAAGVTGTVDEADRSIHQFNTTGSVSIRSSVASGTLDIRFPVQTMPAHVAPAGACTQMRAVLRDTGAGVRVILRLMQLGIASGLDGQLTSLGGIDSDTSLRTTNLNEPKAYALYTACLNANDDRPFLFDFFTYYVEAQLIKTSSGRNPGPGLMAVQICHTEEQCQP